MIDDITYGPDVLGSIEVGLLPYFPSFSMWLIDPDRLTGKIIVEIYGHRTAEPNPTFMLVPDRDAQWYAYFRKQFDLIWETCNDANRIMQAYPRQAPTSKPGAARSEQQG